MKIKALTIENFKSISEPRRNSAFYSQAVDGIFVMEGKL
jgi:DNA repair exonuclease SbcCD ATPase subunit